MSKNQSDAFSVELPEGISFHTSRLIGRSTALFDQVVSQVLLKDGAR